MSAVPDGVRSVRPVPDEVRSVHSYGFRSGEWAKILTTVESHGRECYLLQWPDGTIDRWPVVDTSDEREYRRVRPVPKAKS